MKHVLVAVAASMYVTLGISPVEHVSAQQRKPAKGFFCYKMIVEIGQRPTQTTSFCYSKKEYCSKSRMASISQWQSDMPDAKKLEDGISMPTVKVSHSQCTRQPRAACYRFSNAITGHETELCVAAVSECVELRKKHVSDKAENLDFPVLTKCRLRSSYPKKRLRAP